MIELQDDPDEETPLKATMVAFNGYRFDHRVLKNQITQLEIELPLNLMWTFYDSMRFMMVYEKRDEGNY